VSQNQGQILKTPT